MEPRAYHSGAAGAPPPLPEPPAVGYTRPKTSSLPATVPGPHWFLMVGEEARNLIVGGGVAPSVHDNTQMLRAILAVVAAR